MYMPVWGGSRGENIKWDKIRLADSFFIPLSTIMDTFLAALLTRISASIKTKGKNALSQLAKV